MIIWGRPIRAFPPGVPTRNTISLYSFVTHYLYSTCYDVNYPELISSSEIRIPYINTFRSAYSEPTGDRAVCYNTGLHIK